MEKIISPISHQDKPYSHKRLDELVTNSSKNIEGSPDPGISSRVLKADNTFENLLEEDFQNISKLSKSSNSSEENLASSAGLYTLSKQISQSKPKIQNSVKKSLVSNKSVIQVPIHKNSKSQGFTQRNTKVSLLNYEEASRILQKNDDSLRPTPRGSVQNDRAAKIIAEINDLKKLAIKQQMIIKAKDKKLAKVLDKYEGKVKALEEMNRNLLQELKFVKRSKSRRTVSWTYSPLIKNNKLQSNKPFVYESLGEDELKSGEKREIIYGNGVRVEIYASGYMVTYYNNGDIKQVYPDGRQVYFFAYDQTMKTTFANGIQVIKFSSGQREKLFPDGTKEIKFIDGSVKCIFPSGQAEIVFANGNIEKIDRSGIKTIVYADGKTETIYGKNFIYN